MSPEEDGDAYETQAAASAEPRKFASGRYIGQRLLGEGAQKTVFLVHDTALDRDCALSLIKTDLADADDLSRVRREAQAMAQLGAQPHIVTVFDLGEEGSRPYIVCEFVSGGDLRKELRQAGGPLPLHRAIAIAQDICRALAVAHSRGIVHRDIKPANVWLTERGSAKLGDFGVALAVDRSRLTMPGTVMGTAAYMAPEQASRGEATERSDLYSLGCLLYEMVAGRPPFSGDDPMAVVSQHVHSQPAPPSGHNPNVPPALDDFILRLLAKAPERRPASANHALDELQRIAAALPETEAPRPARRLALMWASPLVRIGAAAALLAVIVGAAAGGVVMSRAGGGTSDDEFQEISYHLSGSESLLSAYVISGGCGITGDLVGRLPEGVEPVKLGDITGDISGESFATAGEFVFFAAGGCQSAFATITFYIEDSDGNELHLTSAGPTSRIFSPNGGAYSISGATTDTVTGGTGIYEGATGGGTCATRSVGQFSAEDLLTALTAPLTREVDCTLHLSMEGARWTRAPLVAGLAPSPKRVGLFGSQGALPTTVQVHVSYWNGGNEPLTGLSLRLPAPAGATIVTSAQRADGGAQEGARVWRLPDLPPGGEIRLFEFQLQFLAAETGSVPLVVEIDGQGFDEPVRSEPVTIEVVQ